MNENYLNGLLAELWEQVSSQQFRAVDTTASFSNGTDNASRHPLHLSDVRPPMSVSPTPCDFLKGLAGLIPNVDPSFFVSSQTAASENRDYRPLYSLGGSTVKTRKTLQKMAERKDKREIDPFFWPYAQGTNLFGYDSNGLPIDYVVTAPRKYVARYDVNGNPIYTYDRNLSMGYVTPPKTEEEKRRAEARTEIKNRQRGELTGTAKVMSDISVGGIGSALAPLALQPWITSSWPAIKATLPAFAKAEIGGKTMDLATRVFTPYNSWGEAMGALVNTATGWNPNEQLWSRMAMDFTNPGYWNPYGVTDKVVGAVGNKILVPIDDAVSTAIDNGAIWDSYTTFRGRFGNYGDNLLTNMYDTWARRIGLPYKARIPADTMRKITDPVRIEDGLVDFTGNLSPFGTYHTNATLDRPVVSHNNWIGDGADTYIMPTRDFLRQTKGFLKSIEPSDMFSDGARVMIQPSKVTVISGDIETLKAARKSGMQTLSSPRLRSMYRKRLFQYSQEKAAFDKLSASEKVGKQTPLHPKAVVSKRATHEWPEYAAEVQRLQSQRGTPTLEDFRLLEDLTGLNAGVAPISEYQNALIQINTLPFNSYGEVAPLIYPNGREVDIFSTENRKRTLELLLRAKYNNVFYDPATMVESEWKVSNGLINN